MSRPQPRPQPRLRPLRQRPAPAAQDQPKPRFSILSAAFKFGALPLTVLSVILALLSYGYLLGLLEPFRASPEQLQLSAFDYLQRSYRPLLAGFLYSKESGSFDHLVKWTENIWWGLSWIAFIVSILLVSLIYLVANDVDFLAPMRYLLAAANRWNRDVRARLLGYSAPVIAPIAMLAGIGAAGVVIWTVLVLFLSFVAFIPMLGASSGLAAAREGIIQPAKCRSRTISNTASSAGARCVLVMQEGQEVARGRFVEQGPARVLLYRKASDSVISVPIDKSTIEDVDVE